MPIYKMTKTAGKYRVGARVGALGSAGESVAADHLVDAKRLATWIAAGVVVDVAERPKKTKAVEPAAAAEEPIDG